MTLECNGVIKYARGERSCAKQECMDIPARIVKTNSLIVPAALCDLERAVPPRHNAEVTNVIAVGKAGALREKHPAFAPPDERNTDYWQHALLTADFSSEISPGTKFAVHVTIVKEEVALGRKDQPRGELRPRLLWRSAHLRIEYLPHDRSVNSL
jgi:hypothetical protein